MKDIFTIGEVSRLFQLKSSALRYYCDIGLLTPTYVDPVTGYRYFSTAHFERVNTIKYLQTLGLSLQEIQTFVDNRDPVYLVNQLHAQREITHQKIKELQEIKQKIDNRIQQIEDALSQQDIGVVKQQIFPIREMVVLRQTIPSGADLELFIRNLENSSKLQSAVFLGKIGMSIAKQKIEKGQFDFYDAIFLLLENEAVDEAVQEEIPGGLYVTLRFQGTHAAASTYYEQLLQYIKQKHYEIIGDSVEVTHIDYGLSNNTNKFVTEIQIPVITS
ncbi:MerR family transcriptional regulator [Niallia circulans]|uniref:MerR family transcriptional regulator n=1 Tax=Niallia circulans TaxID=1397 RepID=UPI00201E2341|nr:MerR family transcriptional regulator [Niallia circulans]UQZ74214.1 MerR family transcriptional regulator [Niallia circulans]